MQAIFAFVVAVVAGQGEPAVGPAPDSPELQALSRYVGKWDTVITFKNSSDVIKAKTAAVVYMQVPGIDYGAKVEKDSLESAGIKTTKEKQTALVATYDAEPPPSAIPVRRPEHADVSTPT